MPKPKVLALVLAGVEGSRLELLTERRANGRPWDLDRTHGGLRLLPPQLGSEEDGFHEGNADAIWRNRQLIAEHDPEVVLVLSADHVYRLDYGEALARHRERRAGVTVVTSEVPKDEAASQAVVEVAGDGRLSGFHYKPEEPSTTRVTTEVFTFRPDLLLDTLDELAAGDGELKDFGHGLLPRLVGEEARVPGGVTVGPGGRFGGDDPEEASS
jgi:glucose-1-phosphate adenylyltransferase